MRMALYAGPPIDADPVLLVEPRAADMRGALHDADLADHEKGWMDRAEKDGSCFFFAIERNGSLIGQILLHDINRPGLEAMAGYHLFHEPDRGQGSGTAALRGLADYAFGELGLRRLVISTSLDNTASRRIAEKCGFLEIGPAREGPELVVYEALSAAMRRPADRPPRRG